MNQVYILYLSKKCQFSLDCYRLLATINQSYCKFFWIEDLLREGYKIPARIKVTPTLMIVQEDQRFEMYTGLQATKKSEEILSKHRYYSEYKQAIEKRKDETQVATTSICPPKVTPDEQVMQKLAKDKYEFQDKMTPKYRHESSDDDKYFSTMNNPSAMSVKHRNEISSTKIKVDPSSLGIPIGVDGKPAIKGSKED